MKVEVKVEVKVELLRQDRNSPNLKALITVNAECRVQRGGRQQLRKPANPVGFTGVMGSSIRRAPRPRGGRSSAAESPEKEARGNALHDAALFSAQYSSIVYRVLSACRSQSEVNGLSGWRTDWAIFNGGHWAVFNWAAHPHPLVAKLKRLLDQGRLVFTEGHISVMKSSYESFKPPGATCNDVAGHIRPAGLMFDTI
ncbi:hypothetical protein EYF80_034686 [Liparis tanakae]|uniref:Uncharacterized protein n=1 Tax=Liparis tanakae TaxID=230148 RepID=A0A4Z2GQW7_9TELE|nr:hypothetical protein EYF80_034686 [Liparis tanakae]